MVSGRIDGSLDFSLKVKVRAGLTFILGLGAIAQWMGHEARC